MIKKLIIFFLCLAPTLTQASETLYYSGTGKEHILVNNRVLAKVNDKAISVIDIMKRMDVLFYKQYPEYITVPEARLQFYEINWRHVLNELIDKELVLADAIESKIPASNGDVRQEMEDLFGPNIIANLDKAGLSYEEAWEMVKGDILIRRMYYMKVNNKAQRKITPQTIRSHYEKFAQDNIRPETWQYRVISFRGKDATKSAEAANQAHTLLTEDKVTVDELESHLKHLISETSEVRFNLSEPMHHSEKEISSNYFQVIGKMNAGEISHPVAQHSRSEKTNVFRIFCVIERNPGGVIPFNEVEAKLKENLLNEQLEAEMIAYLDQIKNKYHINEKEIAARIPDTFKPFSLY